MKQTKRWLVALLALLLALALLPASALCADPPQEIRGAVNASTLRSGADIIIMDDTVLTLDANKTVRHVQLFDDGKLTIRGTATLTVSEGITLESMTLESGTLRVSAAKNSEHSGVEASTLVVSGGTLLASDGGAGYGVEVEACMTVTGGNITAEGRYSGLCARQLLVSGGSISGTGTGTGSEFDSCDGVYTEVLKMSGGFVQGKGSEAGITADRMIFLTEGVGVVQPAGGKLTAKPINIPAWGNEEHPYLTNTVLDSKGAIVKQAALGVPAANFHDVSAAQYYAQPVEWAAAQEITTGSGDNVFSPTDTCTRSQVVTFLWRAAGTPEPKSTENRFVDVKPSDYFYKAVLWAVERGITDGTDDTHFDPAGTCTRGHVVTFLYRYEKSPAVTGANPFDDVKATDYFYAPVLWAVSKGVTDGVTATQFAPASGCTRGQVVTFLYRDLHKIPTPEVLPDDAVS